MLVYYHCHMFSLFYYIFLGILLDYPIDKMPSDSSLFLLFSISENPLLEIFSELHENLREIFIRQEGAKDQRATWGSTQGPGATPGRGLRWGRGWDLPLPPGRRLGLPRRL